MGVKQPADALGVNYAYATWQRPTQIPLERFAKIGVQFDF